MNERAMFDHLIRSSVAPVLAGVDEAGRGPLAGPVVAAAVILEPGCDLQGVDDSKKLSSRARAAAIDVIAGSAIAVGIGVSWHDEIDVINIRAASLRAMERAVSAMGVLPDLLIVDGKDAVDVPCAVVPLVGADHRSQSVAAASIMAKVARDELMIQMDCEHPGYGFAAHKGYPTPQHLAALQRLGPCAIHRLTFKGVC